MPSDRHRRKRILFASVLKPVDEPRMYERMGQSLVQHGFDVFIAGFPTSPNRKINGIEFLPHKKFARVSFGRVKTRFKILGRALSLKPDVLIICTHELIGIAILFKFLTGNKIVYDVQENYRRNIIYTDGWPRWLRPLIAFPMRWKEWITSPFFSKFLLAEKCYERELSFVRNKSVVIKNKCRVPVGFHRQPFSEFIQLLFTGTVAEATGIFEAIDFAKKLHHLDSKIRLHIVGHFPLIETFEKVKAQISGHSFVELTGGADVVPHEKIFEAISSAHFGIISYRPSPHTQDKTPTKLYEYLACRLPILLQSNPTWIGLCASTNSAIAVDFQKPAVDEILRRMRETKFYTHSPENVEWRDEERLLLTTIRSVLT